MRVKPKCIVDRGKPGKGPKLIPVRKGTLGKYGYSNVKGLSVKQRHAALDKAVKAYGALDVFRKLNAVSTLTRNTSPKTSAIFKRDRDWVRKQYMK